MWLFVSILAFTLAVVSLCVAFGYAAAEDNGPALTCVVVFVVLLLLARAAFLSEWYSVMGESVGAWRELDAQATISAAGGPSVEEFRATTDAESAAWEIRSAQALATAQAGGKP